MKGVLPCLWFASNRKLFFISSHASFAINSLKMAEQPRNKGLDETSSLLEENQVPRNGEMRNFCVWETDRKLLVDLLAGLFGISAWLSVNAMYTQLPLLVQSAPEGWNLPSYLSILIQLANVGVILFSLKQRYFPKLIADNKLIYFVMILGSCALVLMAFLYNHTVVVFGELHSVPLFILTYCIALVGCTSSVLFIPFMNHYPQVYLISYMIGEGLSGFIPSIVSLIQGIGGNPSCVNTTSETTGETVFVEHMSPPNFSSQMFFLFTFLLMFISTIAFFLLNNLDVCLSQRRIWTNNNETKDKSKHDGIIESGGLSPSGDSKVEKTRSTSSSSSVTPYTYAILLLLQTVYSMVANGALPSIQSYSCLPYGNFAYHLAVNLSNMANPVACFLTFFIPFTPLPWIFVLSILCAIDISYLLTTAALSPSPPLQHMTSGVTLIVISWVICTGLLSFLKLSVASIFHREGGRGLFWYGAVTQAGATLGSVVMFYLVNYAHLFESYNPCSSR